MELTRISRSRVVENGVSGAWDPVGQGSEGPLGQRLPTWRPRDMGPLHVGTWLNFLPSYSKEVEELFPLF
ncbi:hypothetical protein Syun_003896 [Stephania yunnanensis]|uniref:Uncharacterized protein n=1 Tax=Stephania yunnanensis TaxID=152371 RepID=A0AAP0L524_9MAGN